MRVSSQPVMIQHAPVSISVVVPTLEEADRVAPFLQGVIGCLGPDDEVVLVDGGSADGTLERARALDLPRVRVLSSPPGRATQMNEGAAHARGSWILFLHADSQLSPGCLDSIRAVARGCEASWGHFRLRITDPARAFRWIELGIILRSRALSSPSGDQGLFVERDQFERLGGFPDVPLMEDLILADRLRRRSPPARPSPAVGTSARRWRAQGIVRTVLRMWALRAAFRLGVSPERLARHYAPVR